MASTAYVQFSITTAAGTSTVRIDDRRFISFPIEAAITTEIEYSVVGAPIATGNLYEGKILWQGAQFLLTRDEYFAMQGLIRRQEAQRREGLDFAVTFDNLLYPFIDPSTTRTRAIASGSQLALADGTVSYFARHNVAIVSSRWDRDGRYYKATMDWQELELSA